MAVNRAPSRAWSLYRELFNTIQTVIQGNKKEVYAKQDLDITLRKFKPDFVSFLQNPARNVDDRNAVRQANKVGLAVQQADGAAGGSLQILSTDFITEALTISDLFDLNELASVELLMAGEAQQPYYPGLPRGLVAILLYYDGKACIARAMRMLLQARSGRTWALPGLSPEVVHVVTTFTDVLIEGGLICKLLGAIKNTCSAKFWKATVDCVLDLIGVFEVDSQIERLESPDVRAIGPPRHRQQVTELITDIRQTVADCVFCVSAQSGLKSSDTLLLINYLSRDKSHGHDGALTDVSLALIMSLLYAVDVRILEQEDSPELIQKLPIMSNAYVEAVHREVCSDTTNWAQTGLLATLRFAWGLTIHTLSHYSLPASDTSDFADSDELLIDSALAGNVFTFLRMAVVANGNFHREEYYVRKVHYLITDFIDQMPLKTKELRNTADETARIIMASMNEGLTPSANLRRDFEYMLALIAELYSKDPLGLELALDFWYPVDQSPACDISILTGVPMPVYGNPPPQRQMNLYKFVRLAGDILLPPLYVPYINALVGLANGKECAHHCFNLLRLNGGTQLGTVSWEHFFASLNQYYANLRQEVPQTGFASYAKSTQFRMHGTPMAAVRSITPQEVDGLRAVLSLIGTIVKRDESSRVAMSENQIWHPLITLVGLLTCAVPVKLKSAILQVLTSFAKTPHIASALWQSMELAQVLQTIRPSGTGQDNHGSGIQLELEEVESRNEEYPMLIAYLELMNELTNFPVPPGLGAGYRIPGFQPYLDFLCDSVFLKFKNRAYKRTAEKWQVAGAVLEILYKLLSEHEVRVEDFVDEPCFDGAQESLQPAIMSKPPGHTLLLYMTSDSNVLRMIQYIIDEACRAFDRYVSFPGKAELEVASLFCLKIIEGAIQKQEAFMDAMRLSGAAVIGARMDKLMLSINQRTGRSDHLINIAKFVAHNSTLPRHAYSALRILIATCQSPVVHSKIVGLFTVSDELSAELLRGFVECLESEEPEGLIEIADEFVELDVAETQMRCSLRQDVVWLLLSVINQPAPNLAHFLLGFDIRKPLSRTTLQDAGVLGSPRTCLHAVVSALSRGVDTRHGPTCLLSAPQFAELAYRLIYVLCSDRDTSGAVLRYLRTHDFLYRHLQHFPVPYADGQENLILMQQSWLVKTVVVELRVTSLNRQRSHTHRLMNLLLDDSARLHPSKRDGGLEPDYIQFDNADYTVSNTTQSHLRQVETRASHKLLTMLGSVDFCLPSPSPPELVFFSPAIIEQVVSGCEHMEPHQSMSVFNVKLLHKILMKECNALPATTTGHRSLIVEEIARICAYTVERNAYRAAVSARRQAFDAWRQVVEILLTACPGDLLQGELRQNVIFELLQDLLDKVSKADAVNELTYLVAGVLLTLMSHLRHIFHMSDLAAMLSSSALSSAPAEEDRYSQYISLLDDGRSFTSSRIGGLTTDLVGNSTGSRTVYASSLQVVLRGLLQHMLRCSGSPPRVRAYLYGALLYYLQIAQKPKPIKVSMQSEPCVDVDIGGEFTQLTRDNMATINSYGSNLMEIICRDACDGHDVGRMLALSALDLLIAVDYQKSWFSHLSSRGYIQHVVDSLLQDDEQLKNLLHPQPEPLRALYIFQSKIALLTRIAESSSTARILLDCALPARLAQCTVFDLRPESDRLTESFIPSVLARYRQQILFPVLRLLLALIVSFGKENRLAANQVLHFINSHIDVFLSILRDRQQNVTLESLQELALTTAVVGRVAFFEISDDWSQPESCAAIRRLQRQMFALLAKYCAIESRQHMHRLQTAAAAELLASNPAAAAAASCNTTENTELGDIVAQMEISIYEVLSNVVALCTTLVSKSGTSSKQFRVLFEPSLFDTVPRDPTALQEFITTMCNSLANPSCPPRLGLVLYLLNTSSQQFTTTLDNYRQLHRKYTNLSDMSPEEMKQLYSSSVVADLSCEAASTQKRSEVVSVRLGHSLHYRSQQLRQLSYIIENCMFLLWRHLEFYMVHCVPVDRQTSLYQLNAHKQTMKNLTTVPSSSDRLLDRSGFGEEFDLSQSAGVTTDQIEQLKRDVTSNLNDALFKRLKDMEECYTRGRTRHGFVSAIIRRLVRLARLHTVARPCN